MGNRPVKPGSSGKRRKDFKPSTAAGKPLQSGDDSWKPPEWKSAPHMRFEAQGAPGKRMVSADDSAKPHGSSGPHGKRFEPQNASGKRLGAGKESAKPHVLNGPPRKPLAPQKRFEEGAAPVQRREWIRPSAEPDDADLVYGIHAVEEVLLAGERLVRIHIGEERRRDPVVQRIALAAQELGVPLRYESRTFYQRFPHRAHQHVIAVGAPFVYASLDDLIRRATEHPPGLIVVLDHLTDPHNLGAIIRSVECAGATGVVIPERRSAGVTAVVRKAAAGATAHLPVAQVSNVAGALRSLKRAGLWIVGTVLAEEAKAYDQIDLRLPLALVVGEEGRGVAPIVRKECDLLAMIPLAGRVASLNASVAAAVVIFEALRQRSGRSPG
ncbi:MAG TPA: 23S rRNA (guanosine(2251)-2'-O)-methyltransferase RlmB [Candidatus Baltobacteraceae bacterium]|jgi:23S rRNA (guanosine2251-2'-O)-methyltransferase|nr:23S rRNA (guanosine(2251)-2'-O)-methyltransferase RlmB [Candidatus Baltobacteraceae bacterium]